MTCGIYRIFNLNNGKCYIGKSKNIERRWHFHYLALKSNCHHSIKLQRAWNKHGEKAFEWQIIREVSKDLLMVQEAFYIASQNSIANGYNVLQVDLDGDQLTDYFRLWFNSEEGQKQFQLTLKTRRKMTFEEYSQNIRNWHLTEEGKLHLANHSKKMIEYRSRPEVKKETSDKRHQFLNSEDGQKWCKEHSAKLTGRTQTDEANRKRSETCLARGDMSHPHSQETKDLLSSMKKGKFWWTDGKSQILSKECPGEDWRRGRK